MPLRDNIKAWRIATSVGLVLILVVHAIWLLGVYTDGNERPLRLIGAIVTLLVGTSYLRLWTRHDEEPNRRFAIYQGLGLLGSALIALNLVFVYNDLWNRGLATIGLIALFAAVLSTRSTNRIMGQST